MTTSSNNKKKKYKPISRASAPNLRGVPIRLEFDQDSSSITSMHTPAPLPPAPRESEGDGWFEQMATNPAQIPDLGAMAGGTDPGSLPGWARGARLPSAPGIPAPSERSRLHDVEHTMPYARAGWSRGLSLLLAAVCLAVGLVIGALMQSSFGHQGATCPDPTAHATPTD